jgi:hypothetical protein
MCSTHRQLSDSAAKFIRHEDWVAHLECSLWNEQEKEKGKGEGGNKPGLKLVPAPFFTSSSSSLSQSSYSRAPFQSRSNSKSWINHDIHTMGCTHSSTYGHSLNQNPVKVSGASCRYGMHVLDNLSPCQWIY